MNQNVYENTAKRYLKKEFIFLLLIASIIFSGCSQIPGEKNYDVADASGAFVNEEYNQTEDDSGDESAIDGDFEGRLLHFLDAWKSSFHNRSSESLVKLITANGYSRIELRDNPDFFWDDMVFGWSSPWPWTDECFKLVDFDNDHATFLIYAVTSEPHVTVWIENIQYKENPSALNQYGIEVFDEDLEIMSDISSYNDLFRAYPEGIIEGTAMDYFQNLVAGDLSDVANRHTKEIMDDIPYYEGLYDPEMSVISLLNLSEDRSLVSPALYETTNELECIVTVTFPRENKTVRVCMRRRDNDSPWVPVCIETKDNYL